MKSTLVLPLLLLVACAPTEDRVNDTTTPATTNDDMVAEMGVVVGEDPGDGAVLFVEDIVGQPDGYLEAPVIIAGVVGEVCQNAGCWLTFQNEEGVAFRVSVPRDDSGYAFTFPKDISGSHVAVAGTLTMEETSVETLRHLAEDRGDDAATIAAITAPERTLILTATGARIESRA